MPSSSEAVGDLPNRIFVVRHGERLDSKDKRWWQSLHSDRPHDSPLTDHGRFQGRVFGAHVLDRAGAPRGDAHYSVVTSPMVRAVDTAHHIAEPLQVSKIHVDEALIEVGWYMQDALTVKDRSFVERSVVPSCRAVVLGDSAERARRLEEGAGVRPTVSKGGVAVPICGVSLSRDALQQHVSPLVNAECHGIAPREYRVVQDAVSGELKRANGDVACCEKAAQSAVARLVDPAKRAELPAHWRRGADHTLVLVGHGDSVYAWCKALLGQFELDFPAPFEFNCFVELRRKVGATANPAAPYELVSPYFGTDHLKGARLQELTVRLSSLSLPPIPSACPLDAAAEADGDDAA